MSVESESNATALEPQTESPVSLARRIHLERIAFVVLAGAIVGAIFGILIGLQEGIAAGAQIFGLGWLMGIWLISGCYHLAGGMDWRETLQRESQPGEPEGFNWVLFVMEPLYFLLALLGVFIIVLVYMVVSLALGLAFSPNPS